MKRHVPHTVLECESPMLKFPPADLMQRAANVTERRAAWMICTVIARINAALELYKKRFCPEGFNSTKAISNGDLSKVTISFQAGDVIK